MARLKEGDYVLATKWSDGDPRDQWCIGYYKCTEPNERIIVVDDTGSSFREGGFRKVKKISQRRGDFILSNRREILSGNKSLWWWARQPLDGGRQ